MKFLLETLLSVLLALLVSIVPLQSASADGTETTANGPSFDSILLNSYQDILDTQANLILGGAQVTDMKNLALFNNTYPTNSNDLERKLDILINSQTAYPVLYANPGTSCEGIGYTEAAPFVEHRYIAQQNFVQQTNTLQVTKRLVWFEATSNRCMAKSGHAYNTWK